MLGSERSGPCLSVVRTFGADLWSRFLAPFLSKYLPRHPTVLAKNLPGGGSFSGANIFAATAKPDGLSMLNTSGSTQIPILLGLKTVKYDYSQMRFFPAGPTGGGAYISSKLGVTSLKELPMARPHEVIQFGC